LGPLLGDSTEDFSAPDRDDAQDLFHALNGHSRSPPRPAWSCWSGPAEFSIPL
jgi:hypothetical protein